MKYRHRIKQTIVVLGLGAFILLGVRTFALTLARPVAPKFMEDFDIFIRAFQNAAQGNNPYESRYPGTEFLYPPPSLFVFAPFGLIASPEVRAAIFIMLNLVMLTAMLWGVGARYGYSLRKIWWWFPLAFGFAPFLELLFVGQINLVTLLGIFLAFYFADTLPALAGVGLWLAVVTKVTPLAFFGYLFIARSWRALGWGAAIVLGSFVVSTLVFGIGTLENFVGVLNSLRGVFYGQSDSQALVSIFVSHGWLEQGAWFAFQEALNFYVAAMCAASAAFAWPSRRLEPFFIVLNFGVAILPNNLWYNRHVFLLLPIFVWLAFSRFDLRVVAWCVIGLFGIQVDRYLPTQGLLIHLFAHVSIVAIVVSQLAHSAHVMPRFARAVGAGLAVVCMVIGIFPLTDALNTSASLRSARDWIERNLPSGSRIALGPDAPPITDSRFVVESFSDIKAHPPDWYERDGFEYVVVGGAATYDGWQLAAQIQNGATGVRVYRTNLGNLPPQRIAKRFGIFADWIELVGDDFDFPRVEFFWRVIQPRREPVHLNVRLLDSSERLVDQAEAELFASGERWQEQVFTNTIQFSSPPAIGVYQIGLVLEGESSGAIPVISPAHESESEQLLIPVKIPPPPPSVPEFNLARPLDARFGDGIILTRYALGDTVRGGTANVRLYWRAEKRIVVDYTVFVHLLDANGKIVAQSDVPPLNGVYPTSAWDVGEIIADEIKLNVPAALESGEYRVEIGVYNSPSLARLNVSDASGASLGDHILLGTIPLN